ncbi:PAS domain-containing sensor histidine kinase [Halobacillus andaensis]|uniref:histidine kinase n=1 Tax=Halobacillus andaensis TaxID=1176239 RepID=A0A917AYZ6_HALAA|nr:ATP-binding protein [Halobacillus andaensis]MBP2002871.1 two-component system phosphate regulon sensor histidine kinase PhoR [Halobacillus andaensis]GGF06288.1 PAS domain-containing sensor histidine kinase [Halobacillus andaensis]
MRSRTRPLLTYTVLVIIVMVSLGVLLAQLTRSYFITIFEERISVESEYFVTYVEGFLEDDQVTDESLNEFSEQINTSLVFISNEDELLIDTVEANEQVTEEDKTMIINLVQRSEESMRQGKLLDNVFYYPLPQTIGDTSGTLILISPVESLSNITKNIWLIIGLTLLIGLVAIFFIGYNVFSNYIRPIRSAAGVADELAKGNYKARTYEGHFGEAGQLSRSINILARNLQKMTSSKGMQENQLEAVINNMGSGLILIDEKGYIQLVNRAFLDSFGGTKPDYVGYLYHDAIPFTTIHETVQNIYMFEETVSETFILPVDINRKHLEVTGAPIFSDKKKWKGIVLVFHDITDMKKLEQMRKDFVANVSHELKTPITSIRGFSETLLDGAMKDEQMLNQFLEIILKESERLQSLIQDLLELSKVEREDFHLTIEQINMQNFLRDLVPMIEHQAAQRNISLQANISGSTLVEGDSSRLKQVFINLMSNAINYTGENGEVRLDFQEYNDHVVVSIEDNGVGIPEEEIPRIFERFYRVDKARSRNSGGTGLGLAIVKHIVEAHHGSIQVESEVGKGTIFHVKLIKEFTNN